MAKTKNIDEVWVDYKQTKNSIAKEEIINHYLHLVKYIASRLKVNYPAHVELGDLVSSGILGMLDAIDKFDLERGLKFETYAMSRIRGAIIDELRNLDWAPRSVRKKASDIENTYVKLQKEFGRVATENEVADDLDINVSELNITISQVNNSAFLSLDEYISIGSDRENINRLAIIEDEKAEKPDFELHKQQVKDILGKCIEELPKKIKQMVALYYFENLNLKEIGEVLGVSESRVCQIHSQAMLMLRGKLKNFHQELKI